MNTPKTTPTIRLFDYQRDGVDFLSLIRKGILGDEMGTGKTIQGIQAAKETSSAQKLVICPASIKYNWDEEIRRMYPTDKVFVLSSDTETESMAQHFRKCDWVIVNYDLLEKYSWLETMALQGEIDTIIMDEAHYIKNGKAKRTKLALRIADKCDNVFLLTGTPVMNRPIELYTLLQAINHPLATGEWLNYVDFGRTYCDGFQRKNKYTGRHFWDFGGASNLQELHERIKPYYLRRLKKDNLDLPEKMIQVEELEMDNELRDEYETAWDAYMTFCEENPPENMDNIIQAKHLIELQKMKQVCSQGKVDNIIQAKHLIELQKMKQVCSQGKVDYVVEKTKELLENGHKVIIFSQYTETIKAITKALNRPRKKCVTITGTTKDTERQEAVELFQNDPAITVFVGNIKAAGVGITLTAADAVIFADLEWTPALHAQAEDRAHRIGQKNAINVYYPIYKDSVEEDVKEMLEIKSQIIEKIMSGESNRAGARDGNIVKAVAQKLSTRRY